MPATISAIEQNEMMLPTRDEVHNDVAYLEVNRYALRVVQRVHVKPGGLPVTEMRACMEAVLTQSHGRDDISLTTLEMFR